MSSSSSSSSSSYSPNSSLSPIPPSHLSFPSSFPPLSRIPPSHPFLSSLFPSSLLLSYLSFSPIPSFSPAVFESCKKYSSFMALEQTLSRTEGSNPKKITKLTDEEREKLDKQREERVSSYLLHIIHLLYLASLPITFVQHVLITHSITSPSTLTANCPPNTL